MSTIEQVVDVDVDDLSDLADPEPLNQAQVQTWEGAPAPLPPPPPPAPRLPVKQPTCALQIPDSALYGVAGEIARSLDSPLNWAYPSVLTLFTSRPIPMTSVIRPTLYCDLVGPPEDGKSLSYKRAMKTLGMEHSINIFRGVPGSDRGLEEILAQPLPAEHKKGDPIIREMTRKCIVMDEALTLLSKMSIQGSGLALSTALTHLWDEDEESGGVKKDPWTIFARISMLGALACKDRTDFSRTMGVTTLGGYFSRLLICPGPNGWKYTQTWRPTLAIRHPSTVTISDDNIFEFEAWRDDPPEGVKRGRICEIAERIALISASLNHDKVLTPECIQAALRFAEWQEKVKRHYHASQALNPSAECMNALFDDLAEAEDEEGTTHWIQWSDIARRKNWHRRFGNLVRRAKQDMIDDKLIVMQYESGNDGEPDYRKPKGWVHICK